MRVNLELVRETLGDRAAAAFDGSAVGWYRSALAVVDDAPDGCFTGSTDADPDRRAVLDATVARLNDKIDAASVLPHRRHRHHRRPHRPLHHRRLRPGPAPTEPDSAAAAQSRRRRSPGSAAADPARRGGGAERRLGGAGAPSTLVEWHRY